MKEDRIKALLVKLLLIIIIALAIVPSSGHLVISLAQTDEPPLPPDSDLDGLSDAVETGGWFNERANDQGGGVPYRTDPYDTDSDDDGLSDGEEMLFNTHPTDSKSPGLHIVYEDRFETGEYEFAWTRLQRSGLFRPHGHKMISTNTAVIRRGTTFNVGGPATVGGYTVNLSWQDGLGRSGVLSALNIQRNPCGADCNSWMVTVPSGGTVGKYKLTASNGHGWTDTLILDVIFEIPRNTGLTEAQIDAFLYDGNRNNKRDETGIWFYDSGSEDPEQDIRIRLNATKYNLSQYEAFIFDGAETSGSPSKYPNAIQVIHGLRDSWSASARLTARVDALTCFAYPLTPRSSAWNTLFPGGSNVNNQCSNIAGLVTSVHRSVGIPARLVATDHRTTNFDTSAEIWTRPGSSGSYNWYTTRAFLGDEANGGVCTQTQVTGGYRARMSRAEYGRTHYKPYYKVWPSRGSASNGNEWMIVTVNENWSETETQGTPADYKWVAWDKYNVARKNWFLTQAMPYWNNSYRVDREPTNVGDPDIVNPPQWGRRVPSGWESSVNLGSASPLTTLDTADPTLSTAEEAVGSKVRFGDVVGEYGVNEDGDGQYEGLVLQVQVEAQQGGSYWVQGDLGTADPTFVGTGGVLATDKFEVQLQPGMQTVNLFFDGLSISRTRINGPYQLLYLLITDVANPGPDDFVNNALDARSHLYTTASYQFNQFKTLDAMLARSYVDRGIDSNGDGYAEGVEIEVGLDIYRAGTYQVRGELYAPGEVLLGEASWSGTGSPAVLRFEQLAGTVGPYELRNLRLSRGDGQGLDEVEQAYQVQQVSAGPPVSGFTAQAQVDSGGLSSMGVGITATQYIDVGLDTNGNGKYDVLQVQVGIQVVTPGAYHLEGWLVDEQGELVLWARTGPVNLAPGAHRLPLNYNGRAVLDYMKVHSQDSQRFRVVALKLYSGPLKWDGINDEVDVAHTTQSYDRTQFEAALKSRLFDANMEQGTANWSLVDPIWAVVDNGTYFSQSRAWRGANGNGAVEMVVNLGGVPNPILKFRTYHRLNGSSDVGYVKISLDGTNWQTIATLSDSIASWKTKLLDLSPFANQTAVRLRFELNAAGGNENDFWYLDDVQVAGKITDSDRDGLSNGQEKQLGTNPNDPDTDKDGLPDGWEVAHGFDPRSGRNDANSDADGDGVTNLVEYQHNMNPRSPDSDGDGLPDGWEFYSGLNPLDNAGDNGARGDPDHDELTNLDEYKRGTNPFNPDTDGDGKPDKTDPVLNYKYSLFLPFVAKK